MQSRITAVLALALLCCPTFAYAQGATARDEWEFSITPYVWLAGFDATLTLPNLPNQPRDLSASFDDIFTDLSSIPITGTAEIRYGRFALAGDVLSYQLSKDFQTPAQVFQTGEASANLTGLALIGMFRVIREDLGTLDVGGGIRPWFVSGRLTLGSDPSQSVEFKRTDSWIDPVLALRGHMRVYDEISLTAYGDIGGFGAGSELTWQAVGTVDWQPVEWVALRAGWRYLALDFESGAIELDTSLHGPILGATFRF